MQLVDLMRVEEELQIHAFKSINISSFDLTYLFHLSSCIYAHDFSIFHFFDEEKNNVKCQWILVPIRYLM